ncbi:unnamed protein product, partial [marine sediment metagenome]
GSHIVGGLLKRGYQTSILHRGVHEVKLSREVEHIHADPHFVDTLAEALGARKFDLIICTYGRLRYVALIREHDIKPEDIVQGVANVGQFTKSLNEPLELKQ